MADARDVDETRPLLAGDVYKTPSTLTLAGDGAADVEAGRNAGGDDNGLVGTASPSPSPTLIDEAPAGAAANFAAGSGDPDNPRNWPDAFKWTIVCLLAFLAFTVTFTCISVVPFAGHIVKELEGNSGRGDGGDNAARVRAASVLLVTIWELGEAAGPLAIAPLSETATWGRASVLKGATTLFALTTAAAALAPSTTLFIAARGLTGVAVATNVLNPAIVGDLFPPEQRGSAMALVQLTPLMGGAIGPAIGGALADTWGWRSVLWLSTALATVCNVLVWFAFRETYPPAILRARRRTGKALAAASSPPLCASPAEEDGDAALAPPKIPDTPPTSSGLRHIRDAVLRPAILLADSFVLAIIALFGSVLFSYFYVMSVTLPDILENRYGFSSAATGTCFLVFSLGAFVSVVLCNVYLDSIYLYLTRTRGRTLPDGTRVGRPEFKLPLSAVCSVLMPLAVAAFGWAAELRLPLPWLLLAESMMGASMIMSFIPLAAYVVDSFGLYAASAMTGVIVTRCLCGTFLPLAAAPLVDTFGYGWGFTVLGGGCLSVAPIPFAVFFYGEKWRQLSKYTQDA